MLASPDLLQTQIDRAEQADSDGQFTSHYGKYLSLQAKAAQTTVNYNLSEIRKPWWRKSFEASGMHTLDSEFDRDMGNPLRSVGVETYDNYIEQGFQFAIVHSDHYRPFLRNDAKKRNRFPAYSAFYRELMDRGHLLKEFAPGNAFHGPVVRVYRFSIRAKGSPTS